MSDIRQIKTALELYFHAEDEYPNNLDDLVTEEIMIPIPSNPSEDDCTITLGANNNYYYNRISINEYELHYCLVSSTGGIEEGNNIVATQMTIDDRTE